MSVSLARCPLCAATPSKSLRQCVPVMQYGLYNGRNTSRGRGNLLPSWVMALCVEGGLLVSSLRPVETTICAVVLAQADL
jgi:hypothetical protein